MTIVNIALPSAQVALHFSTDGAAAGVVRWLLRTWHPATRPAVIGFDPAVRWVGLEGLDSTEGDPFGGEGIVEFRARYTDGSVPGEVHERSRFVLHDNASTYLDGT